MDRSPAIIHIVKNRYKDDELCLLGEMQIAFILFMVGENIEGFEQWKKIFYVICNSENYLELHKNFCLESIRCIFNMLKQFPHDFFYDALSKENFIEKSLNVFYENCKNIKDSKIDQRLDSLKKLLLDSFNLEMNLPNDDELPVIVDDPYDFISF